MKLLTITAAILLTASLAFAGEIEVSQANLSSKSDNSYIVPKPITEKLRTG